MMPLGNGVNECYGYATNRMQLTSQTATKSGGPANGLMNLTYSYQASAGQMGTGSTSGNAGQLISVSGTLGGTVGFSGQGSNNSESASYSYDNLGRLITSNQTSNGSSAQRRFAYDRWGNRTGEWNAVSSGTQIQSVVLQQSGGAPTNRLTSVTNSSVTVGYTYDAAGSVTNDGVHSYTYDAENRVVSVDGGTTATYAYDLSNERYKKVTGGATTHYVWQGSQVIAEHNAGTGAVLTDYVYSGSTMIAKVASGTTQYFLSDRLSARLVLDTSGNVSGRMAHLPYGEDFGESGMQEKHHFTSYERDGESVTDYAVNRQYSQTIARFMRPDLFRRSCRSDNPQNWNRYSYTRNDPVNRMDPSGLDSLMSTINNLNWWAQLYWLLMSGPGMSGKHDLLEDIGAGGGGGEVSECNCSGTEDCSFYHNMCKKTGGKTEAAIAYYCAAAKLVCAFAGHSCTANCIRQSLQDLDVELKCIDSKTNQDFANCEAAIHAIAYTVCIGLC